MSDTPHKPTHEESPLNQLWVAMTGASTGHGEAPPGLDDRSQTVGHEPDEFGIKGIIAVPVAVVVTLILTYLVVTGVFAYLKSPQENFAANGQKPFNERAGRISSTDPQAVDGQPNSPVAQPRLEQIRQIDDKRSGETQSDPAYLRSFTSAEAGNNSPEIYPQFFYPTNFTDPTSKRKALRDTEWIAKDKGIAQISIDETIHLMTTTKKLPTKAGATAPVIGTLGQAKPSSGGRGGPAEPKAAPKTEHHHHD